MLSRQCNAINIFAAFFWMDNKNSLLNADELIVHVEKGVCIFSCKRHFCILKKNIILAHPMHDERISFRVLGSTIDVKFIMKIILNEYVCAIRPDVAIQGCQ